MTSRANQRPPAPTAPPSAPEPARSNAPDGNLSGPAAAPARFATWPAHRRFWHRSVPAPPETARAPNAAEAPPQAERAPGATSGERDAPSQTSAA
jgi:hypothetical protein